ncbi:hypothetical protein HAX54_001281, partial [Datura stramonium]|nr:hypothetical protein [Datura stramonium]
ARHRVELSLESICAKYRLTLIAFGAHGYPTLKVGPAEGLRPRGGQMAYGRFELPPIRSL